MSNPYYVPKDNSKFTNALAVIKLGLDAYNDYSRNTLSREHEDLMKEDLALRRESQAQEQLYKQQEREATEKYRAEDLGLKKQEAAREQAKLPEHQKNWGRIDLSLTENVFVKLGVKKDTEVMQALSQAAETPGVTKGQVYEQLVAQYPYYAGELAKQVSEDYAAKVMKDANYANTREGQTQRKFVETIEADPTGEKTVGQFFARTKESLDQEKAKATKDAATSPLSLEQVKGQIAQAVMEKKITPEEGQKYMNLISPQKPVAVPEGGSLVDPGTFKTVYQGQPKTTDEMREYNLAKEQGETRSFTDWKTGMKKAGASPVTVTNRVGQGSMEKLGEEMAKELVAQRKDVMGAVNSLNNLKEAKKILDSGIITGTGAEYLTNAGNFLSSRLGITFSQDPVANTQAFAATMGTQVGQIIKQFGSGTGLSDADREYAEKIVGGKITLNENAIRKLIDINEKAFTNVIKNYNALAKQAMSRPGAESLPYDLTINYDFGKTTMATDDMSRFWKK
jgi:hypothetical protein